VTANTVIRLRIILNVLQKWGLIKFLDVLSNQTLKKTLYVVIIHYLSFIPYIHAFLYLKNVVTFLVTYILSW